MRILLAFRVLFLGALLLGLANLIFDFNPRWAVDVHLLLGVLVALTGWGVLWPLRNSGLARAGIALSLALLVLGFGLRYGWWGGLPTGIVHLVVALGTAGVVEASAARAKCAATQPA